MILGLLLMLVMCDYRAAAGDARIWVADFPSGANARPISPGAKTVDLQGDGCFTPISQKVPACAFTSNPPVLL